MLNPLGKHFSTCKEHKTQSWENKNCKGKVKVTVKYQRRGKWIKGAGERLDSLKAERCNRMHKQQGLQTCQ